MRKKSVRTKGKLSLSKYFQKFETGDFVAVIKERAISSSFPERLQGKTGQIEGVRGRAYVVKINDMDKEKKFLIEPIHLKGILIQNKPIMKTK